MDGESIYDVEEVGSINRQELAPVTILVIHVLRKYYILKFQGPTGPHILLPAGGFA